MVSQGFLILIVLGLSWFSDYLIAQTAPVCVDGCKCSETIWNCRKSGLWIWPTDTVTSPAPHVLSLDVSFNPALLVFPDHPLIEKFPGLKLVDIRGTGLPCHSRYCLELGGVTVFSDCPAGAMRKCSQSPCCFVKTAKSELEGRGITSTAKDMFRPTMAPVSTMKLLPFISIRPNVSHSTLEHVGISETGRFIDEVASVASEFSVFKGRTEDYQKNSWRILSSTDKRPENSKVSPPSLKTNTAEAGATVTSTDILGIPNVLLGSLRKDLTPLFIAGHTIDLSLPLNGETTTPQLSDLALGSLESSWEIIVSTTSVDMVIEGTAVAALDEVTGLSEYLAPSNVHDLGADFGASTTGSPVLEVIQPGIPQPADSPEQFEPVQAETSPSFDVNVVPKKGDISIPLSDMLTTDAVFPLPSGFSAAAFPSATTLIPSGITDFMVSENITLVSSVRLTGDSDHFTTRTFAAPSDSAITVVTEEALVITLELPDLTPSTPAPAMVSSTLHLSAGPLENSGSQPSDSELFEEVFTPSVRLSILTTTTAPSCRPCQPCTPCSMPEVSETLALTQLSERDYKIGTITMTITTGCFLLAMLIWKFWWTTGGKVVGRRNERSEATILNETGFSETTSIFQTPRREPLGPRETSTPKEAEIPMSLGNPFFDGNRDLVLKVATSSADPAVQRDQSESLGSSESNDQPGTFVTAIKAPRQPKKSELPEPSQEMDRRTLRNTVRKNYKE